MTAAAPGNLLPLLAASRSFFQPLGGEVGQIRIGRRRNIEVLDDQQVPEVIVCSLEVTFEHRDVFGEGDFREAYSRYRQMRTDWWSCLAAAGMPMWTPSTGVIPHLHPLPGGRHRGGRPYPRQEQTAFGARLTHRDRLRNRSSYYRDLFDRFGVTWVLEDPNGIVIGPDAGLLQVLAALAAERSEIRDFLDVGAGTGELSAWLLRHGRTRRLRVVEASARLQEHLEALLVPLAENARAEITFEFRDAIEMELPESIDFLSLGIYYGAQPDFLRRHGPALAQRLAPEGIIAVQSGMLEGTFNIASLTGEDPRLLGWPWYDDRCSLPAYVPFVRSLYVADELVTLGSSSAEALDRLTTRLAAHESQLQPPALEVLREAMA